MVAGPHSHSRFSDLGAADWSIAWSWRSEVGAPHCPEVGPVQDSVWGFEAEGDKTKREMQLWELSWELYWG